MGLLRLTGKVDEHGKLTVQLPERVSVSELEVRLEWPPHDHDGLLKALKETFGTMPDLRRPEQAELPPPLPW